MTAQVIFLNKLNYISDEEREELEKMQEFLTYCHVQFDYETRGLSEYEKKKRKDDVHKRARKRLGIVKMIDQK